MVWKEPVCLLQRKIQFP